MLPEARQRWEKGMALAGPTYEAPLQLGIHTWVRTLGAPWRDYSLSGSGGPLEMPPASFPSRGFRELASAVGGILSPEEKINFFCLGDERNCRRLEIARGAGCRSESKWLAKGTGLRPPTII